MDSFEIVFEKLGEIASDDSRGEESGDAEARQPELDEIEELRRFSAELLDLEPASFTTT